MASSAINFEKIQEYQPHAEEHIQAGDYLKSSVYGGMDGVINTLTIIVGGIASGVNPLAIFAMAMSVIIGDGLGMGLGDYLSVKAEKQFIQSEQARQFWEVENKLQDEKQQVVDIYTQKGYTESQSRRIAELYSTNSQAFVNIMMLEQLGLVVNDSNQILHGLTTFFSFVVFGIMPIIPYIVSYANGDKETQHLAICLIIGGVELFSLGFAKAMLLALNPIKSGIETLLLGAVTVAIGYGIGLAFEGHVGEH